MRRVVLCFAIILPAVLASLALAEIWCYDANDQFLGVHQSNLTFLQPKNKMTFELSGMSGDVSFSPYYFKEEGCGGQPYTMLAKNRVARGPDGKLHSGSSPLIRFKPVSYLNERNECVKMETEDWTGSFSNPVEISDLELPISFPVAFPLTYKYIQVGSLRYGAVHSGTPTGRPRRR